MKNIKISESLHNKVKIYCAINNLRMSKWVEDEIKKIIEKYNDIKGENSRQYK